MVTENIDFYKNLRNKANSFSIEKILAFYFVKIDPFTHMARCPFKSHKNGNETTPSFKLFKETNSFYCYGCGIGGKCVNFVSSIDNINKTDAALKIIELFSSDDVYIETIENNDGERLEILLDFSNFYRQKIEDNLDNKEYIKKIERISSVLDIANETKNWDNKAFKEVVFILKNKIEGL